VGGTSLSRKKGGKGIIYLTSVFSGKKLWSDEKNQKKRGKRGTFSRRVVAGGILLRAGSVQAITPLGEGPPVEKKKKKKRREWRNGLQLQSKEPQRGCNRGKKKGSCHYRLEGGEVSTPVSEKLKAFLQKAPPSSRKRKSGIESHVHGEKRIP